MSKRTPTEDLILEVLKLRYCYGGNLTWSFENALVMPLGRLAARGLIGYKHASVPGYRLAWLTNEGFAEVGLDHDPTPATANASPDRSPE